MDPVIHYCDDWGVKIADWVRRYPVVAATIVVAVVGLGLQLAGFRDGVVLAGRRLRAGDRGLAGVVHGAGHAERELRADLLAVTAITATVLVGDHWAALIVVLMLTGGEALEDYANARAHREVSALLERARGSPTARTQRRPVRGGPDRRGRGR